MPPSTAQQQTWGRIPDPIAEAWKRGDTSFSDMKLVCQDFCFHVHKVIVCLQSPVIAAAMRGPFVEATTNTYTIGEQNVFSVGCMVEFMYTGTYNIDICTVGEPPGISTMRDEDVARLPPAKRRKVYEAKAGAAPCWFRHLGVYAVADVYGLPELAEAAMDNVGLSICPPPAVRLGSETRAILAYLAGEVAEAFGDCEDLHEMLAEAVVAHPLNFSADDIERPGLSLRLRLMLRDDGGVPRPAEGNARQEMLRKSWTFDD